ncbi:hypothetical protein POL68_16815 [Stigmatella sp. ncwal1]|uniref:Uncharacterized protein n=1 Tax=Stigmatella ashevillensis TaxID=2995309 RepID=A0ABT5D904_9BACT|nr:hypothetical protein [Stigmatella ashevillena]MDC0710141.1 hypothetical protein [Stigmatella ashevillena]
MRKKKRKKERDAYYEDEGLHGGRTLALAHRQGRGLLEVGQGVRHRGVNRMGRMMHWVKP